MIDDFEISTTKSDILKNVKIINIRINNKSYHLQFDYSHLKSKEYLEVFKICFLDLLNMITKEVE